MLRLLSCSGAIYSSAAYWLRELLQAAHIEKNPNDARVDAPLVVVAD